MRLLLITTVSILALLNLAAMRGDAQRMAPRQSPGSRSARLTDPYVPHLPPRAASYHRAGRSLFLAGIVWRVLGLVLLLRTGVSGRFRDWAQAADRSLRLHRDRPPQPGSSSRAPGFRAVAAYLLLYSSFMVLWSLPVGLGSLTIERHFGFSNEGVALFLYDRWIALCLGWVIIPVVWLAYRFHVRWPARWWLALWAVLAPAAIVIGVVYPMVVAPLFNRYHPLPPGPLRTEILALANRSEIRADRVLVEDTSRRTSHVNAYVTGLGSSARIVLNDTALQQLPDDQILAMMAHEMGHYAERHVLILALANALGTGILLAILSLVLPRLAARIGPVCRLRGLSDLAAFPLVMLTIVVLGLLTDPVGAAISRSLEHRADAYGLRLTGLKGATARLMVGFAERDLIDPDPPFLMHVWFDTHPTLTERIAFALRYSSPTHRGAAP